MVPAPKNRIIAIGSPCKPLISTAVINKEWGSCMYHVRLVFWYACGVHPYLSFRSCDSCRRLPEPKHHSFLFSHWSSKCLVFMAARTPSIHVFLGCPLFVLSPSIQVYIPKLKKKKKTMYSWGFFYFLFCTMTNECTINWQFITQYMY